MNEIVHATMKYFLSRRCNNTYCIEHGVMMARMSGERQARGARSDVVVRQKPMQTKETGGGLRA